MKPLVSLIPEPDRSTEARKPLTKKQRAELALAQDGICGCGECGQKLNHASEGTIDEHWNPLGLTGTNDMANRRLLRAPCAAKKTHEADMPRIVKAKAQAGETGQYARRMKRGGGSIKSGGFEQRNRKFNGTIGPTRKALRQAANDEAGLGGNDGSRAPKSPPTGKGARHG